MLSPLVDTRWLWAPTVAQISQLQTQRQLLSSSWNHFHRQQRTVDVVGTALGATLPWFLRCSMLSSEDSPASSSSQQRKDTGGEHCLGRGMQQKLRPVLALARATTVPTFSTLFSNTESHCIVQAGLEFTIPFSVNLYLWPGGCGCKHVPPLTDL